MSKCEDGQECDKLEDVADKAVAKVFAILGVDVNVPKDVESFREDLRFSKSLRRASDRGMLAVVSLVVAGLGVTFYAGIRGLFE